MIRPTTRPSFWPLLALHLRGVLRRERPLALLVMGGLAPGVAVLTAWLNLAWTLRSAPLTAGQPGWLLPRPLLAALGLEGVLVGAGLVSLLIGCLGLANVYTASVERRMGELALWQALGLRRAEVLGLLLGETGLAGMVGSGLGVILGLLLAWLTWPSAQAFFRLTVPFSIQGPALATGFVTGLVAVWLFAGVTAWAAWGMDLAQTLRGQLPASLLDGWQAWRTSALGSLFAGLLVLLAAGPLLPPARTALLAALALGLSGLLTGGSWLLTRLYHRLPLARRTFFGQMVLQGLARHPRHTAGLTLAMMAGAYGAGLAALALLTSGSQALFTVWVALGVLVAGASLVLTAAYLALSERCPELERLVALGMRPSRVRRLLLAEYAVVALGGGSLGALLAFLNWLLAGGGDWLLALIILAADLLAALFSAWAGLAPILWRFTKARRPCSTSTSIP